jgi:hypothetical protein
LRSIATFDEEKGRETHHIGEELGVSLYDSSDLSDVENG